MKSIEGNHVHQDTFLTPTEVAQRWRWHPESVRRWTRIGKLPLVKVSRRTLIPLSAIEALEADGRIASKSANVS